VSKVFLALGIGFVYFFLIFLNYGGQILSNLVGFIFPGTFPLQRRLIVAYESIKAIESVGSADDTQWLTYWVVFSFFNVVEYWSRTILYWLRVFPTLWDKDWLTWD
jgi:receptor expression-enhancing protein 5/6